MAVSIIKDTEWLDTLALPGDRTSWAEWLRAEWRDILVSRVRAGTIEGDRGKEAAQALLDALDEDPPLTPGATVELSERLAEKYPDAFALDALVDRYLALWAVTLRRTMNEAIAAGRWDRLIAALREFHSAILLSSDHFHAMKMPPSDPTAGTLPGGLAADVDRFMKHVFSLSLGAKIRLAAQLNDISEPTRAAIADLLGAERNLLEQAESKGWSAQDVSTRVVSDWERCAAAAEADAGCRARIDAINRVFAGVITVTSGSDCDRSLYPSVLFEMMRRHVVGQEQPLRTMSVALFEQHLRRTGAVRPRRAKPTVVLLAGPSGSGKTYITRLAAGTLDLPFMHANAARLVQAGIVGTNLTDLLQMIRTSAKTPEDAAHGVLFIDEIDKLYVGKGASSGQHYAEAVQNELLMLLEGEKVKISHRDKEPEYFDTSRLLFVLGGAFEGLEEVVRQRVSRGAGIGFGPNSATEMTDPALYAALIREDLIEYGFATQLLGRVSSIAVLEPLSKADFLEIMKRDEISPFSEHRRYFEACGDALIIDDDVYEFLAAHAAGSTMGIRKLFETVTSFMTDLKFATANRTRESIHVTRGYLENRLDHRSS